MLIMYIYLIYTYTYTLFLLIKFCYYNLFPIQLLAKTPSRATIPVDVFVGLHTLETIHEPCELPFKQHFHHQREPCQYVIYKTCYLSQL